LVQYTGQIASDKDEVEESQGTRGAQVEKGGGEKEKEEKRGRETDGEKAKEVGERGEDTRKGDAILN